MPYACTNAPGGVARAPYPGNGVLRDISNVHGLPSARLAQPPPRLDVAPDQGLGEVVPRPTLSRNILREPTRHEASHPKSLPPLIPATPEEKENSEFEYAPDILKGWLQKERTSPSCLAQSCLDNQTEVTARMRRILIDWIVEVEAKYRMRPETLFLTVNIIDRYLARVSVPKKRLQLVGVVAMFIASKFEEAEAPRAETLVYISDNSYTVEEIFKTECHVLAMLNFEVLVPTAASFLDSLQRVGGSDSFQRSLSWYILELSLMDQWATRYLPSVLASAALLLSNELENQCPRWSSALEQASLCSEASLKGCVEDLRRILSVAHRAECQAVQAKYSRPSRHSVAKVLAQHAAHVG